MTRHILVESDEQRFPQVGDLIRSTNTMQFINIVLEVSDVKLDVRGDYVVIRSVRYGHTNSGEFELLDGQRSRAFKYHLCASKRVRAWHLVKEFTEFDNSVVRAEIVKRMESVDTVWRESENSTED